MKPELDNQSVHAICGYIIITNSLFCRNSLHLEAGCRRSGGVRQNCR